MTNFMPDDFTFPRREYPRPDRRRGTIEGFDWLNLNGPWQFRFDRDRAGENENWHAPESSEWREQIVVPFCWESLAAWREGDAAGNENYYSTRVFLNPLEVNASNHRAAARYEVGWYRRRVEIPNNPAWQNKRIILTVGAADFFTDCWCEGKFLGHHEGGYTPFEFDLTDALKTLPDGRREGTVVFRVEDPMDNHEQPVGKQWRWYTTTSGIWQTVFIEPRGASCLESFRITPDIDKGDAHFAINCAQAKDCTVLVEITAPNGVPLPKLEWPVKDDMADGTTLVQPLLLWDTNAPNLYQVKLSLRCGGKIHDVVHSYFGMRKIDFAPAGGAEAVTHLRLNERPRYLRGALYQAYFPEGVYTAGDVGRLKSDILYAKKFGFNFLRIHIKVDDPLFLFYADTMGMLLMADFPNFGEAGDTSLGKKRFEQMMRETIKRDFNHPSIIAWCMFNETWGFGGQVDLVKLIHPSRPVPSEPNEYDSPTQVTQVSAAAAPEALKHAETAAEHSKLANLDAHVWVQTMWELAKKLDPTRLVEDMSVCHWEHLDYYAHGDTDINSWHFYINDYARAKEHINNVVNSTYVGSSFNYIPGFKHRGQPLINSEYGGIGALDGDRDVSWSFKFLTNELRRQGKISAYIYTELHDVEWEYNGFLNYDRTPKQFGYDPSVINASNVLPVDAPPISRVKPGEKIKLSVSSSHYSMRHYENVTLTWRVGGVDNIGRLYRDLQIGSIPVSFPQYEVAPIHTIELRMPEMPMLCVLSIEAVVADGSVIARNFLHYLVSEHYPPLREERERLIILRQPPHGWSAGEWSERMRSRERSESQDACFGHGHGFLEWTFPVQGIDLSRVKSLRVLCEASARRNDGSQTDDDLFPTSLEIYVNEVCIQKMTLPNHPHDSRGVLSYLRGGRGAYGYLINITAEHEVLQHIIANIHDDHIRLRCTVPANAVAQRGLTIYGAECGRYPLCPTILLELT